LFDSAIPTGDQILMARLLTNFCIFQTALPQDVAGVLNNFYSDIESVHPPPSFLCLIYKTTFLVACQEQWPASISAKGGRRLPGAGSEAGTGAGQAGP